MATFDNDFGFINWIAVVFSSVEIYKGTNDKIAICNKH